MDEVLFDERTPLGFRVRLTIERWLLIAAVKHPVMAGHEEDVRECVIAPDEIRRSRRDAAVLLFYRGVRPRRWTCTVVRRTDDDAFVITAYPTDAIKEGESLWNR